MKEETLKKLTVFLCFLLISAPVYAGVRFIVDSSDNTNNTINFEDIRTSPSSTPNSDLCHEQGYNKVVCSYGFYLTNPCPENPLIYKECCPNEYIHTYDECVAMHRTPSSYSCDSKHACH